MGSPAVASSYQIYQCNLGTGLTNTIGVATSMVVGVGNSALINPSPIGNTEGNANVFTYILRQGDSGGAIIDSTVGKIAVVEAVRITATVDPTLTFTIDSTGAITTGSTACGAGTSLASGAANTTGDMVVFGSLDIGSTKNNLAQRIGVITNAPNGYVVTAYEAGPMRNIGYTGADNVGVSIPDTNCNGGGCTTTTATTWTAGTNSGFGYSIYTTGLGSSAPFVNGGDGTYFRPFGQGAAGAQAILKSATNPASTQYGYVCYRVAASTGQTVGDYEGKVIYTATTTF
jgi:hypothetical protein